MDNVTQTDTDKMDNVTQTDTDKMDNVTQTDTDKMDNVTQTDTEIASILETGNAFEESIKNFPRYLMFFHLMGSTMHEVNSIDALIYKTMNKCEVVDDDWVCALCDNALDKIIPLCEYESKWVMVKGICGHIFHIACVRKQIAKNASDTKCTVCSKEILCSCNV